MSNSKSNASNWWKSSAEADVKPAAHNPYKETPRGGAGRGNYGGRGRGGWSSSRPTNPYTEKITPEPFDDATSEIVRNIIHHEDPNITVSAVDFGDIEDPRENYRAQLYVAAHRGYGDYKAKRSHLAKRWQFESEDRLIELINDPDKMEREVTKLNATHGAAPSVTEYSPLNDFPHVLGEDVLYGIGSSSDDRTQLRTYQLTGIRRILARCFGTGEHERAFYESIVNAPDSKLHDFYNRPNKFIEAVWTSRACPAWNPVQLPQADIKKKPQRRLSRNLLEIPLPSHLLLLKLRIRETPMEPPKSRDLKT
jgi:hypothetical protein